MLTPKRGEILHVESTGRELNEQIAPRKTGKTWSAQKFQPVFSPLDSSSSPPETQNNCSQMCHHLTQELSEQRLGQGQVCFDKYSPKESAHNKAR